jgi:hypothetical protein
VRDALPGTISEPRREFVTAVLVPRSVQCQPLVDHVARPAADRIGSLGLDGVRRSATAGRERG